MPANPVMAGATLTAGLRADFARTYESRYAKVGLKLQDVMDRVTSDKLEEIYAYFEAAPYPARWPRGSQIQSKPFGSVQFTIKNVDWGRRIEWHVNDREDDQTQSLFTQAQAAGANWATLDERVFMQIITGTSDPDLLESIPNAPDGSALYATTAGGSDRFGVSGGNTIESPAGVSTAGDVRTDLFTAVERTKLFQDTEGEPLWPDDVIDGGFVVYYNADNYQIFQEAFIQGRTMQVVQDGGSNVSGAAVTNVVLDSGLRVELRATQRITDNDWFLFLKDSPLKAVVRQERQPLRSFTATFENNPGTRDAKIEYIQWDSRTGYGVLLPYQTVRVNN